MIKLTLGILFGCIVMAAMVGIVVLCVAYPVYVLGSFVVTLLVLLCWLGYTVVDGWLS